jgi:hypothetical protein
MNPSSSSGRKQIWSWRKRAPAATFFAARSARYSNGGAPAFSTAPRK